MHRLKHVIVMAFLLMAIPTHCYRHAWLFPRRYQGMKNILVSQMRMTSSIKVTNLNLASEYFTFQRNKEGRLELVPSKSLGKMSPFCINFSDILNERGIKGHKNDLNASSSLVCRAIGRQSLVVDMTAGLGRDAVVLAASRSVDRVHLIERNAILSALLEDALKCFMFDNKEYAQKMSFALLDATQLDLVTASLPMPIAQSSVSGSVLTTTNGIAVYLDPMYPANTTGRKAMVKKDSQILRLLVEGSLNKSTAQCSQGSIGVDDPATAQLFHSAWRLATTRVVVKRPLAGEPILHYKPHEIVKGTRQRFDIYFKNRQLDVP